MLNEVVLVPAMDVEAEERLLATMLLMYAFAQYCAAEPRLYVWLAVGMRCAVTLTLWVVSIDRAVPPTLVPRVRLVWYPTMRALPVLASVYISIRAVPDSSVNESVLLVLLRPRLIVSRPACAEVPRTVSGPYMLDVLPSPMMVVVEVVPIASDLRAES